MGGFIPSYQGKEHSEQYPPDGLQQAIWDRLKADGFFLSRAMSARGNDLHWARVVRW